MNRLATIYANDDFRDRALVVGRLNEKTQRKIADGRLGAREVVDAGSALLLEKAEQASSARPYTTKQWLRPATTPGQVGRKNPIHLS